MDDRGMLRIGPPASIRFARDGRDFSLISTTPRAESFVAINYFYNLFFAIGRCENTLLHLIIFENNKSTYQTLDNFIEF